MRAWRDGQVIYFDDPQDEMRAAGMLCPGCGATVHEGFTIVMDPAAPAAHHWLPRHLSLTLRAFNKGVRR